MTKRDFVEAMFVGAIIGAVVGLIGLSHKVNFNRSEIKRLDEFEDRLSVMEQRWITIENEVFQPEERFGREDKKNEN